jgi:hypothetical protein
VADVVASTVAQRIFNVLWLTENLIDHRR